MKETNLTASVIISFAEKLEDNSSKFYEKLAQKYGKESFLCFAKESKKNKILITRTYQETISDALEACFIKGLDLSNSIIARNLTQDMSFADALKTAIELEEKAVKFYVDVAERTKSLLATIPMVFRRIAENRKSRNQELKALLQDILR